MIPSDLLFLRLASAVLLAGLLVFVNKRLSRGQISFTLGIVWSISIATALLLCLAPSVLLSIAAYAGAEVPVHFLFFTVQFFLVLLVFGLTLKSARQERQITRLCQEIALVKLETELQLEQWLARAEAPSDSISQDQEVQHKRLANQR